MIFQSKNGEGSAINTKYVVGICPIERDRGATGSEFYLEVTFVDGHSHFICFKTRQEAISDRQELIDFINNDTLPDMQAAPTALNFRAIVATLRKAGLKLWAADDGKLGFETFDSKLADDWRDFLRDNKIEILKAIRCDDEPPELSDYDSLLPITENEAQELATKIGADFIGRHPGDYLQSLLDKYGLNNSDVARKIHVPVNRVTTIRKGERGISAETAALFSMVFDDITCREWMVLQNEYKLRAAIPASMDRVSARSATFA